MDIRHITKSVAGSGRVRGLRPNRPRTGGAGGGDGLSRMKLSLGTKWLGRFGNS